MILQTRHTSRFMPSFTNPCRPHWHPPEASLRLLLTSLLPWWNDSWNLSILLLSMTKNFPGISLPTCKPRGTGQGALCSTKAPPRTAGVQPANHLSPAAALHWTGLAPSNSDLDFLVLDVTDHLPRHIHRSLHADSHCWDWIITDLDFSSSEAVHLKILKPQPDVLAFLRIRWIFFFWILCFALPATRRRLARAALPPMLSAYYSLPSGYWHKPYVLLVESVCFL